MRAKITLTILLVFAIGCTAYSQSVYYLNYRFTNIQDTTLYHVFLVRYDDGTGFYRVRFYDDVSKEDVLVDLNMEEMYAVDKKGNIDQTKLYFKGSDPEIIAGDKSIKYYPERFWFKMDTRTGVYEPWGVTSPDEKGTAQGKFVDPPELIDQQDLTKDFVSIFFLENEDFYENLFTTTSRALTPDQKKTQLHIIIVANTEDESIGNTCVLDKDRTLKTFKDLAEYLGIGFDPKVIFGSDYNKQNVQNAIQSLNPGAKDIVVFYYSGHGFSNQNDTRQFPNMALSNKSYEDALASSMNIEDVFSTIKKKGARFNLVFSDCCNNNPDDKASVSCDIPRTRSSSLGWSLDNCKTLFMNEKPMSILMTAATKGELSNGNASYGGFFTNQFRTELVNYFGPFHQNVTWDAILEEAKKQTTEKAEKTRCSDSGQPVKTYKQHPVYKIL
ncbi:caspase family protein [Ferruginibacter sp. SUN106]|uniref:caspase family protein n=1 Tax=Ferruginibacter sp. SUN106 TaxID=2978348 RepID=UPI003D36F92D